MRFSASSLIFHRKDMQYINNCDIFLSTSKIVINSQNPPKLLEVITDSQDKL